MISLPAALIVAGVIVWLLTPWTLFGIILLVLGLILAVAGYPAGWYSRSGNGV